MEVYYQLCLHLLYSYSGKVAQEKVNEKPRKKLMRRLIP
jgi:hypothetical protein